MPFMTRATATVVFLWTFSLCLASFKTTKTQFTEGNMVKTSYMTLLSYSDIKCVRKCFVEKKQNRCSVAGYDKASQTCYLSNDSQHDLMDSDDESSGVFIFPDSKGIFTVVKLLLSGIVYAYKNNYIQYVQYKM